jgi:glycosyltransferase involved in cell wall biosynthesis
MAPRVLVDATAVPGDRGGVGRYVDALVAALDASGADLAVACQRSDEDHYREQTPSAVVVPGPPPIARRAARLAWEQHGLPAVADSVGADVLHSPHYTLPLRARRPVVVTLHDATFFTDPAVHAAVKARFFRSATRLSLRRAAGCVVPSQATADELVRVAGATPGRLHVAPHGVDTRAFHPPSDEELRAARERLGLGPDAQAEPYVAFLGQLEPRKNVPALVEGWVRACAGRERPPALVLAGGAGWDQRLDAVVAAVPRHLRVLRPGYLPFADLRGFLGGAEVVAYPSLGEGFGLPVLEAMACGAAVLTTRRLALPEVGGDAVAYTGTEPADIARDLAALLDDAGRRASVGEAGRRRAQEFTWARSAELHLEAYERAACSAAA